MGVREEIENGTYLPKISPAVPSPIAEHNRQRTEQRRAHSAEVARLNSLFKSHLEAEFDLIDHPKAALLFEIAWEDGHSDGLGAVLSRYETLSELLS